MTALFLYDDARARTFDPFALTRPMGEMRAGTELVRRRWELAFGVEASGAVVAEHLSEFEERGAPPAVSTPVAAGTILANTRCVVPLTWRAPDAEVWTAGGRVAAVRLPRAVEPDALRDGAADLETFAPRSARVADLPGRWVDAVWGYVVQLLPQLHEDIAGVGPTLDCVPGAHLGAAVLGEHAVYVERGAIVEPLVVVDVTAGPVLVRRGATVRAFTRLVGPCAVAGGAVILGDRIQGCAIGETSLIRGEMSETVVLGHANKAHDGFIGHSYLGRWVNLGAGTITSDLKNTYGAVALWTPAGLSETGATKLGTFFGDHVKTGIGLRLTTGSVIGAGSNIYGTAMPPKYVPPFSWGEGSKLSEYRMDKFVETADRAMSRRQVPLGERARRQLAAAHALGRATGGKGGGAE